MKLAYALGKDINAVNSMGPRAIHGTSAIISYLAESGALPDAIDNEGRTHIAWADGVLTGARAPFRDK